MAWTFGSNTLNPGESQRWWFWWNGYPGLEVIGVAPSDPAGEIQYTTPGMQTNADGSTAYFLTLTNIGGTAVQYAFTGGTGADWSFGDNTLAPGESQRWWFWWPGYPGVELIGVQCITAGVEIDYMTPEMQANPDGSTTYYLTISRCGEPGQPNITADSNRATIKWGNLIAAATPMPTMSNPDCTQCNNGANPVAADTVGAFEGAGYYHCGLFRGQYVCRMRALGNPYCAACQQVIRQTLAPFMPSWVYGTNTIGGGQTQDWWLWWPGYPGFEVIGVQAVTPGDELRTDSPGIQQNPDGSTTYFLSVINPGPGDVVFHFRGSAL